MREALLVSLSPNGDTHFYRNQSPGASYTAPAVLSPRGRSFHTPPLRPWLRPSAGGDPGGDSRLEPGWGAGFPAPESCACRRGAETRRLLIVLSGGHGRSLRTSVPGCRRLRERSSRGHGRSEQVRGARAAARVRARARARVGRRASSLLSRRSHGPIGPRLPETPARLGRLRRDPRPLHLAGGGGGTPGVRDAAGLGAAAGPAGRGMCRWRETRS